MGALQGSPSATGIPEQGPADGSCGRTLSGVTRKSTDYGTLQSTARNIPASGVRRNAIGTAKNRATCCARHCAFARVTRNRTNYSALCQTSQSILPNLLTTAVLCNQG